MKCHLIPRQAFIRVPWKNGLGITLEIAKQMDPEQAQFEWRLSIAEVVQDGPFSNFDGYQRIISVLNGAGMTLTVNNQSSGDLRPFIPFVFDGAAETSCQLLDGKINDFNVIYNDKHYIASVKWFSPERFTRLELPADSHCFVISGQGETTLECEETPFNLNPWDVLQINCGDSAVNLSLPGQQGTVTGLIQLTRIH